MLDYEKYIIIKKFIKVFILFTHKYYDKIVNGKLDQDQNEDFIFLLKFDKYVTRLIEENLIEIVRINLIDDTVEQVYFIVENKYLCRKDKKDFWNRFKNRQMYIYHKFVKDNKYEKYCDMDRFKFLEYRITTEYIYY